MSVPGLSRVRDRLREKRLLGELDAQEAGELATVSRDFDSYSD
ncbi:unnamed protein product, partial [marine sediment metagenome]